MVKIKAKLDVTKDKRKGHLNNKRKNKTTGKENELKYQKGCYKINNKWEIPNY